MIEVKNLTRNYGTTIAVNDVSFSVKKGEVLGFLGPNGAGKTTTMKVLTCFMPPTSGTATVDGFDILEDPLAVRERIGYLPESTPLYTDMMVEDYLSYIAEMRRIPQAQRASRIKRMIDVCSLRGVLKKDIGALSKGYKQRVGLAQAMIHDPAILILDEPTSGLDPNQIIEIRQLIKELGKEKTIILSTHILPEVSATCDRVMIINEGKLVASGTPDELQNEAAGDSVLYVAITAKQSDIESTFANINVIKASECISHSGGRYSYRLVIDKSQKDCGASVFQLAVERGWVLSEIRSEQLSLEDVFLKLTTGDN
ncbi:MAG: ATP-binding cassette domain-containing protein [Candidatus Auribacterota bacterium]|jgi:ABC-2 type transport system ATP-binding protein|uniref:ATP-binding cassette domain-containing protein n=1 Tax=Candidatus Auribacter fodinae TaxID=2093366 RepID=A0A3A4R0R0_9BACT|nr:MAG: ATP-binding cassette domain-containing protein [Candidatus Auribacter fodinae]